MNTSTPKQITNRIRQLIATVASGQEAVHLPVQPDEGAKVNECFQNVEAKIARAGGSMLCGWQIWEWPNVLVEAEFHAVWVSPQGKLVEITPKQQGEKTILFGPNPALRYSGFAKDNVRVPVRDDLLVHHFILVSEEIFNVMNHGERARQHGSISVPAHEIEPLIDAQAFLGESILSGRRDHSLCMCGSGGKYKRCHGRGFPL